RATKAPHAAWSVGSRPSRPSSVGLVCEANELFILITRNDGQTYRRFWNVAHPNATQIRRCGRSSLVLPYFSHARRAAFRESVPCHGAGQEIGTPIQEISHAS